MQMNAYLSFNGQCEAAFKFYEQCLGGQLGVIFRYACVFSTSLETPHDPSNLVDRHFKAALETAEIQGKVRWHDLRIASGH